MRLLSCKLSPAEWNYNIENRELLAIKWLEGAKNQFTVITDHRNLEYLKLSGPVKHAGHCSSQDSILWSRIVQVPII